MRDSIIRTITTSGVPSHLIPWNQNIPLLGASGVNLRLSPNVRIPVEPKEVFSGPAIEGSSRLLWTLSMSADFPPSNYSRFIVSVQLGGHMTEGATSIMSKEMLHSIVLFIWTLSKQKLGRCHMF